MKSTFVVTQILTGPSPKGHVIAYRGGVLMAYSECCMKLVNWDDYSNDWGCSSCNEPLVNQPYDSKLGPALLPNTYTPNAPGQLDVEEWVFRWTGFPQRNITVTIKD